MKVSRRAKTSPEKSLSWWVASTRPGDNFWASQVAQAMLPTVEECRMIVFGRKTPPFSSQQDADQWFDDRALSEEQKLEIMNREIVNRGSYRSPWVSLETPGFLPVQSLDPKIKTLARWCDEIEHHTGWRQMDIVAFVVLGTIPRVTPQVTGTGFISQKLPRELRKALGRAGWFSVTIYPWQLNAETWEHLRRQILKMTRAFGTPEYTLDDGRLLDLFSKVGAPPKGRGKGKRVGFVAYWKRMADAWNLTYKGHIRWESLRMRWQRFENDHPDIVSLIDAQDRAARART